MVFYELVQNFQFKRSYNKNKFFQIRGSAPVNVTWKYNNGIFYENLQGSSLRAEEITSLESLNLWSFTYENSKYFIKNLYD